MVCCIHIGCWYIIFQEPIDMFFGGTMETRKELGVTTMEKSYRTSPIQKMRFKMLGVSRRDVGITKGIQENLGGVSQVTQETVTKKFFFGSLNQTLEFQERHKVNGTYASDWEVQVVRRQYHN